MRRLSALRRRRDEGGVAAVEFALIMPIFLMLLFGIVDFGYMINRSSVVNNAARDAARDASLGYSLDEVTATADRTLDSMPGATVSVACRKIATTVPCTYGSSDMASGDIAVVTVRYQHRMLTPIGVFVPGGFDLTRKAEMRIE